MTVFIAIDIDGTTTRYPQQMKRLLDAYPDSVLLTGCSVHDPESADIGMLLAGRHAQLEPLIGTVERHIEICVGRNSAEVAEMKGRFCREHSVQLLIDDSPDYCDAVRRLSPATAVLRVWP